MVHLDENTHLYERILDLAPQAVDKIQQMFSNKENNSSKSESNKSESSSKENQEDEYSGPKQDIEL